MTTFTDSQMADVCQEAGQLHAGDADESMTAVGDYTDARVYECETCGRKKMSMAELAAHDSADPRAEDKIRELAGAQAERAQAAIEAALRELRERYEYIDSLVTTINRVLERSGS